MKLGILTFTEGYNYGNKLQNFALETFLKKNYNADVYTVNNKLCQGRLKDKIIIKLKWMFPSYKHFCYWVRTVRFLKFNKRYLNFTKTSLRDSSNKFDEVDMFICGSDQIWNPNYYSNIEKLCGILNDNRKKSLSYAASFGIDELPKNVKSHFKYSLENLEVISVREFQGVKICQDLGLDNVEVHVDPTMLLSPAEWTQMISKPKINIPQRYVLTYFLGRMLVDVNKSVEQYCKINKCERVDLNNKENLKFFCVNPLEFLYLIKNAEMVYTDSYHASVFSILFDKKFLICDRIIDNGNNMNSRIINLVKLFELSNNVYENFDGDYNSITVKTDIKNIVLVRESKKTKQFFDKYLI